MFILRILQGLLIVYPIWEDCSEYTEEHAGMSFNIYFHMIPSKILSDNTVNTV